MAVIDLSPFNSILARLEGVADRLERGTSLAPTVGAAAAAAAAPRPAAAAAAAAAAADAPAIALALDALTQAKLPAIQAAAKESGIKDLEECTEVVVRAFGMLRDALVATGSARKPQDENWATILAPVMELGKQAQKACDNRSEYFHCRKAAAETVGLVTLVTQNSTGGHVQGVLETVDFHAVKVVQKKNPPETAWVKAVKEALKELVDWCKENCKMGLIWKPDGQDALAYFAAHPLGSGGQAGSPAAAGGKGKGKAPPVPKGGFASPPPEGVLGSKGAGGGQAEGGMAAIFGAISGFSTGNLKKVTDDMKTKNLPKEERSAVVPAAAAKAPPPVADVRKAGKGPKGPPILELQKSINWMIENQEGVQNLALDEATMQQLVCVINCKNTTVRINSKVKSISIDGCDRVNVICQDVVSSVELVNCDRCQVQTVGKVNSFAIDKCNGVVVHLSEASLAAEIVSSKSSEMNVTIPGEDGDMIEMPIPEQFVTKVLGPKKLKTEVSSLYS